MNNLFMLSLMLLLANHAYTADINKIHFLIPGGSGGGWDGTARGTGEVLIKSGLVDSVSYNNMPGEGGGKAIQYFIETAENHHDTLMVQSTPIIIRSLLGRYPYDFRNLTPIAGIIGDYSAFVVPAESKIKVFKDLVKAYKANPSNFIIGGGSGRMDHLIAAMALKAAGVNPNKIKYIPFGGGDTAIAPLLSGEVQALSTGLSEVIELHRSGKVRIIAYTANQRIADLPNILTLKEQGLDVSFINWRGFFGPPSLPSKKKIKYIDTIEKMYKTPAWETVQKRNGWIKIYNPGEEFDHYLAKQEYMIASLMKELGFLK